MSIRNEQFLNCSSSTSGEITRFAITSCELLVNQQIIAITVALDWALIEKPNSDNHSKIMANWLVSIYGLSRDGITIQLANKESSTENIQHKRTNQGDEYKFHLKVEFAISIKKACPHLEATIRRKEEFVARSPMDDLIGYVDAPDIDSSIDQDYPIIADWLRGETTG